MNTETIELGELIEITENLLNTEGTQELNRPVNTIEDGEDRLVLKALTVKKLPRNQMVTWDAFLSLSNGVEFNVSASIAPAKGKTLLGFDNPSNNATGFAREFVSFIKDGMNHEEITKENILLEWVSFVNLKDSAIDTSVVDDTHVVSFATHMDYIIKRAVNATMILMEN